MKRETQDILEDLDSQYGIALYGFSKEELLKIRKLINTVIETEGHTIETSDDNTFHSSGLHADFESDVEYDNID